MKRIKRGRGFTLIELMITVAIIALLAAIAYPAYTGYLVRSRRAVAQADLTNAAAAMERFFTVNGTYAGAVAGTAFPVNSPGDGNSGPFYTLGFPAAATAAAFTIRATPVPGGSQDPDGMMEVNQLGQRFWDRNDDGDFLDANENNWSR